MFSFGKTQVRSLKRFGVAGVLGEDSEVFYNALFSTRHIGKISDLLSARFNGSGIDEIKFRKLLIFSIFQAYRAQFSRRIGFKLLSRWMDDSLETPLIIECGIDNEKVAIGLSFCISKNISINIDELSERISRKEVRDSFEEMLADLYEQSDCLIFKYHSESRKSEVISIIGIDGKIDPVSIKKKPPLEVVLVDRIESKQAPKPRVYIDLGDLDYPKLLKEEKTVKNLEGFSTGDFLAPEETGDNLVEKKLRLKSDLTSGSKKAVHPDSVKVLKGERDALGDEDSIVISGSDDESLAGSREWGKGKGIVATLAGAKGKIRNFFRKLWGRSEEEISSDLVPASDPDLSRSVDGSQMESPEEHAVLEHYLAEGDEVNVVSRVDDEKLLTSEAHARKLLFELRVGSFDNLVKQMERDVVPICKDVKNAKVVNWIRTMSVMLSSEKARLQEMARKLNLNIRIKEISSEKKITELEEEMKRKDIQLSAKQNAILRNKEQLLQVTRNMDKLKNLAQDVSGASHFKQKDAMNQRVLTIAKEENYKLIQRVDELRQQLTAVQSSAKSQSQIGTEYVALKARHERLYKQAEEFKKSNRQLMDHISTIKQGRSEVQGAGVDISEGNRRLEAAMKLATLNKKDADAMKVRVLVLQKQEVKLKMEIIQYKRLLEDSKTSDAGAQAEAKVKAKGEES